MKNDDKKKIVLALSTLLTSTGLFLASAFSSPTDLLENIKSESDDDHNLIVETTLKVKNEKSFIERIPFIIKALLILPLWLIGTILIKVIISLFKLILSPILKFLLLWLLLFCFLFLITLIILKLIFPNKSIKELISKKMIISLLLSSLAITIIDFSFMHLFEEYHHYRFLVIFLLGLISIAIVVVPLVIKESRTPKLIVDDLPFK